MHLVSGSVPVLVLGLFLVCGVRLRGVGLRLTPVILRETQPIILSWSILRRVRKHMVRELPLLKTVISMPVLAILPWFEDRMRQMVCRSMCRKFSAGRALCLLPGVSIGMALVTMLARLPCSCLTDVL